MKNIKNKTIILAAVFAMGCFTRAPAQTNITVTTTNNNGEVISLTGPAAAIAKIVVPSGVTLPAFDSAGLSFTNARYKAATGMEYKSGGGVLSYLGAEADLHQGKNIDIGVGADATLSASGTGLHSASLDGELIKNFSNFQLEGKAGIGGILENAAGDAKGLFGELGAALNYNLTAGAGLGFLGTASGGFTYVGVGDTYQVSGFKGGNAKSDNEFRVYAGFAF